MSHREHHELAAKESEEAAEKVRQRALATLEERLNTGLRDSTTSPPSGGGKGPFDGVDVRKFNPSPEYDGSPEGGSEAAENLETRSEQP